MNQSSLNHTYRLVWSDILSAYVPVAENVRGRGKKSRAGKALAVALAVGLSTAALAQTTPPANNALPTGGNITHGSGSISQNANVMTVQQNTAKLIANWNSFNIGKDATVNFVQPNAGSQALNRISDLNASQIMGKLNANGQVFLLNPNGVVFGKDSQVNVGGLVASTLKLNDTDFLNNQLKFTQGNGAGSITNLGDLRGKVVALIAPRVSNQGRITADNGSAVLAAGNQVRLDFSGDGLVTVTVDEGAFNALVENKSLIQADGGLVVMHAKTADALLATVVNNEGVVQARTLGSKAGRILLLGDMAKGQANIAGTLDASAPNGGDGGFVETSAAQVNIQDGTQVTTRAAQGQSGMWLIDPTDFNIVAGTGVQTSSSMGATTLQNNLSGGNITIANVANTGSDQGNINVNSAISWSANSLILNATNDININANVTVTGTGGLELNHGAAGTVNVGMKTPDVDNGMGFLGRVDFDSTGVLKIATQAVTVIRTSVQLQAMNSGLAGKYALGTNITLTNNANNFTPIGNPYTPVGSFPSGTGDPFTGLFDGLGNTISNLRPTPVVGGVEKTAALFGYVAGAALRNVGFDAANVVGGVSTDIGGANSRSYTAVLAGFYVHNSSTGYPISTGAPGKISNIWAAGSVSGSDAYVGGLIGFVYSSATAGQSTDLGIKIDNVRTNIAVSFTNPTANTETRSHIGGLIGTMRAVAGVSSVTVSRSYSLGNVTYSGTSTHQITAVGALVGSVTGNRSVVFNNVFAAGNVAAGTASAGSWGFGGLVGYSDMDPNYLTITDSYATGNVTGKDYVGGLMGTGSYVTLNRVYASGTVTGTTANKGGLISGFGNYGNSPSGITVTNSFYNSTNAAGFATGSYTSAQIKGMSAADLKVKANFTTATPANGNVNPNWDYTPATGTWGMKTSASINSGYPYLCVFWSGCGARITIAIADSSKVYGAANPTLPSYALTGSLQSGDSLSSIAWGSAATTTMDAATYAYSTTSLLAPSFTFGAGNSISDYIIDWGTTGLTVNPKTLTASIIATGGGTYTQAYNGGTIATLASSNYSLVGLVGSESFTVGQTAGALNSKNVDASTVSAALASGNFTAANGTKASNYTLPTTATGTASVTAKTVTLSASKVYDGSTDLATKVTVTTGVTGEALTYIGATANNANVATASKYISAIALANGTGGAASNYQLPTLNVANAPVTITAKALTIMGSSVSSREYNGSTTAAINLGTLTGFANSEVVIATAAGTYNSKDAGTRTVTAVYTLANDTGSTGGLASNYSLANDTITNQTIDKKTLTINGTTAAGRTYNGTTVATLTLGTIVNTGFVGSETVIDTATGTFDSTNAGSRTATAVYTLANGANGGLAANYQLANTTHSATIAQKALTINGLSTAGKVYDGTTSATVSGTAALLTAQTAGAGNTSDGKPYSGDTITITGTAVGNYSDKNKGTGKTVTFTGLGVSNANYTVTNPTTTANITAKALTISGLSVTSRPYDSTTTSVLAGTAALIAGGAVANDGKLAAGETVTITGTPTGTYNNAIVGNGKTVTVTGLTLSDASNYTLTNTLTGDITQKTVAISGAKTYNNSATLEAGTITLATGVNGEALTYTGATANSKNVGAGNYITALTLVNGTGGTASNYQLPTLDATNALVTINPQTLTASIIGAPTKVYNGNTDATLAPDNFNITGLIGSEAFTVTKTAGAFNNKNVLNANTASANLASGDFTAASGTLASNYTLPTTASGAATITKRTVSLTGTRAYDGSTTLGIGVVSIATGVVGDDLGYSGATVDNANVSSTNKYINAITLANGTSGIESNYQLPTLSAANAPVTVTKRVLTITGSTSDGKTYDGSAIATINTGTLGNVVNGQTVTVNAVGTFDSANAGSRTATAVYTVISGAGGDASNYQLADTTHGATIDKKTLAITGSSSAGKTYDGNTVAAITQGALSGFIGTENVTSSVVGTFDSKNSGSRTATAAYTLADGSNGGLAGNYQLADTTHGATIDKKTLAITGSSSAGKTYDGNTVATITQGTLSGFIGTETVSSSVVGTFDSKNTGQRTATAAYTLADGSNGGLAANYQLADTTHGATIDKKTLAITGSSSAGKTYDGNTAAAITQGTLSGFIGAEAVSSSVVGTFESKNTGQRTATAAYTLADGGNGGLAANYQLADTTHTATIDKKTLAITGSSSAGKTYDGNTVAAITQGTLSGLIGTETLTSSVVGTFDSKNSGSRTATAAYTLADGSNGGLTANYQLADTTHVATIDKKPIIATGFAVKDKVFNGNDEAELILASVGLRNTLVGDDVKLVPPVKGQFENMNVGNGKTVLLAGLDLSGIEANNYRVDSYDLVTGNMLPAPSAAVSALTSTQQGTTGTTVTTTAVPAAGADNKVSVTDNTAKPAAAPQPAAVVVRAPAVNAAPAVIPMQGSMSLSSVAGSQSSLSMTQVGDSVTLNIGGTSAAAAKMTEAITTPALPIFKVILFPLR